MTYQTYSLTTYANMHSTGTAADGGVTYHQIGARAGRYYRRRLNCNGHHKAVVDAERIGINAGQELMERARAFEYPSA